MVAIKKLLSDKSDKEKLNVSDPDKFDLENFDVYVPPTIEITRRKSSRTRVCVRLLFLITCFLFGLFLIISGVLLYRYFSAPKSWHDFCFVKYRAPDRGYLIDNGGLNAEDFIDKPIFKPKETANDDFNDANGENAETGELKQEMTLNLTGQTEEINVLPSLSYKRASFLHDFANNWTCIHDVDQNRCLIFPLDRSKISPPRNLLDMIIKSMRGYYLPDNVLLHQDMMVDKKLDDLSDFGETIENKCSDAVSFLLKKRHNLVEADAAEHKMDKRNTIEKRCEYASSFIHSSGKTTIAYDIGC